MFYLPRICEHCLNPACVASCPSGAIYKRSRGRHRPGRPGPLPRLAAVHHRLPVQEDLLQPQDRQGREVHVLLPADRGRAADGVLGDLRGPAALHRPVPLRRRPGHRGRIHARRQGPLPGAARPAPRPQRPRGDRRGQGRGHPRGLAGRGAPVAGLRPGEDLPGGAARCIRSTARCRWSGTSRRCRRSSTCCASRATTRRTSGTLFGAIEALRIPVEYLAELFTAGDTEIVTGVLRRLAAMRAYMRGITLGREPDESIPDVGRHDRSRGCTRCTG